jgi:hypothetical protein
MISLIILGIVGLLVDQELKYRKRLQAEHDREICERYERDDML